jgi:hypothetical protein
MMGAFWNVLVGRYPKIFGRVEKAGKRLKRVTTLETKEIKGYRFQINPELDNYNFIRARLRIKSEKNKYLDNTHLRLGKDQITIGKSYPLESIGKNSILSIDLQHDYKNDYCVKLTLKVPFWFRDPKNDQ